MGWVVFAGFAGVFAVCAAAILAVTLGAALAYDLGTALPATFALTATFDADFGVGLGGAFFTRAAADFVVALPLATLEVAPFAPLMTVLDFDFAFAVANFHSPKATC